MPNNLTSRELNYLEDSLHHELLMVKKFKSYADETTDPALQQACLKIADKHAGHYDILLQYLNE